MDYHSIKESGECTVPQSSLQVTILYECPFWVAIFKRMDAPEIPSLRHIFGCEPTDQDLYEYLLEHATKLAFSTPPSELILNIDRKKHKGRNH